MEPLLITAIVLGVLVLLTFGAWLRARRGRRIARRTTAGLETELTKARAAVETLKLGEQEAAWAAGAASERLQHALLDVEKATHEVELTRTELETAHTDIDALRASLGDAEHRLSEVAAEAARVAGLEQRLEAVTRERDRLASSTQRAEQLETELAALGRVHADLEEARVENRRLTDELQTASGSAELEEEIRRLQQELDAIDTDRIVELEAELAARDLEPPSEGGTYAAWDDELRRRLTRAVEQATSRLEREVAHLRLVVAEKEAIIQRGLGEPEPTRDPVITDIKGIGPKIASILADLGIVTVADIAALDAERIAELSDVMPVYPDRIRDDRWVDQARALLA